MRRIIRPGQAPGMAPLGLGGAQPAAPGAPRPLSAPGLPGVGAPAHGGRQAMSAQAYQAYGESKDILAVAQKEAERIRQEALVQRDEQARQGYEAGYRKGYEEALVKLAGLEKQYADVVSRLEPQLVQLAISVAEKIIGEELALRPEAIVDVVGQALKTVRHQREIVIRVHPSRAPTLEQRKQSLLGILSRAQTVRVVPDETLTENGCVIETEVGRLNADIDSQLEALRKALQSV